MMNKRADMDHKHITDHLERLLAVPGASGFESPVRTYLQELWDPLVDEIQVSPLGSLHGLLKGHGPSPRPQILFAAHMDTIGLMVSEIVGGFIRVTSLGGVDARALPGQMVRIHGEQELTGVIYQPPKSHLPSSASSHKVQVKYLLIDTGLDEGDLRDVVHIGDPVTFRQPPVRMGEHVLAGPHLDNRVSLAALTILAESLQQRSHDGDVWVAATSQEEENMSGALTSGFALAPDIAVAFDVTFATGPGVPDHKAFPLGQGITLGWGPSTHPALYHAVEEVAHAQDIPLTMEPLPMRSGTDADMLQIAGRGIPTALFSIPIRNMHTPVEMVEITDIQAAVALAQATIESLTQGFLDNLSWDE